jgi:hypothetical protein
VISAPRPPRFVPTLTEVVHPGSLPGMPDANTPTLASTSNSDISHDQFEDQLLHRVMQRVDLVLERRLREAVSQIIQSHTQALGPRLREEIELVVRESVSQAIAQELPLSAAVD